MVSAHGIVLRLTKEDLEDDRYASAPNAGTIEDEEGYVVAERAMVQESEPIAEREVITE